MQLILNGDTRPVVFGMVSSADHVSALTGASPTVVISKNGGAFAAPAGAVAEIGQGWYKLTPSGADATTNGPLLLHATASGGDPADISAQVVAFSPYDSVHLGLSALPSAAAGASGGLPLSDALGDVTLDASFTTTLIASIAASVLATPANKLTTDGAGRVAVGAYAAGEDPATLVWSALTASFDAVNSFGAFVQSISGGGGGGLSLDASLAGHATAGTMGGALSGIATLAQIKAGILDEPLSAHVGAGTTGAALGALIGQLAESYAANGQPGTLAQLLYGMLAVLGNVSQSGTTLTANALDGATPAMTFTLDNATAPTSRRRTA
jgi:hypothetical protein